MWIWAILSFLWVGGGLASQFNSTSTCPEGWTCGEYGEYKMFHTSMTNLAVWLGATKAGSDYSSYRWDDGTTWSYTGEWYGSDGGAAERCLWLYGVSGRWADATCTGYPYPCLCRRLGASGAAPGGQLDSWHKSVNNSYKRLGINANGSSMTDFHREIFFFIKFVCQSFSLRILPQKNVLFLIYAFLGGVKTTSTSHPSRHPVDGWADTFITCKKTPHWWSL